MGKRKKIKKSKKPSYKSGRPADGLPVSEKYYRDLFENLWDGSMIISLKNSIIACSASLLKSLGYTLKEIKKTGFEKVALISLKAREFEIGKEQACLKGSSRIGELEFRRRDGSVFPVELVLCPEKNSAGRNTGYRISVRDISAQKRIEEALKNRIATLTQPLKDDKTIKFEDLFDLTDIQHLQDLYAAAFGVAALITRPDGIPITRPSNFTYLCSEIIRKNPKGVRNCNISDSEIGQPNPSGPIIKPCLSAGLCNAGASIIVGGQHVANWLIGQVRNENIKGKTVIKYAREIGADIKAFRKAFNKVPFMPQEQFNKVAQVIYAITRQLSLTAYQNIQQARFIQERKNMMDALRESEEKYRSILENIQDIVYRSDKDGNLIMVSQSFALELGYKSVEDCLGKNIAEHFYYHPPDREKVLAEIRKNGFVKNYEVILKHRDGTPVPVSTSSHLYYDSHNQVAGVEGVFRNMTELKRAEKELHESQNRLQEIMKGSPIPCFFIGEDHRVIFWNRALAELCKITPEEVIGTKSHWKAFYKTERPCLADLLVDGKQEDIEKWYSGKYEKSLLVESAYVATDFFPDLGTDGRWLHFTAAAIKDSSGKVIGAIETLEDITERKKIEQAQRFTQLGQLVSAVAHEVNNPLMIISGTAQLCLIKSADAETVKEKLTVIYEECKKAKDIIERLLMFSRPSKGIVTREDIHLVLNSIIKLVEDQFKLSKISIRPDYGADIPPVEIDSKQIQEVLMNLMNNAKDAMPQGGELEIKTRLETDHIVIRLKDSGCGMSEEVLSKMFNPFFTTKKNGTGLGVFISYGILKNHGGELRYDSRIGAGTTATLILPVRKIKRE